MAYMPTPPSTCPPVYVLLTRPSLYVSGLLLIGLVLLFGELMLWWVVLVMFYTIYACVLVYRHYLLHPRAWSGIEFDSYGNLIETDADLVVKCPTCNKS